MKSPALLFLALLLPLAAPAGEIPCHEKNLPPQSVPRDRSSQLTLEARRVVSAQGDTFGYDLGREVITITAAGEKAWIFLDAATNGWCTAEQAVTLVPERKSETNDRFRAQDLR